MKEIAVIGGGFFGMYLAELCANKEHNVCIYEREDDFMKRASSNNQARVHNGYHYPRSMLTATRSMVSFSKFVNEFSDCIDKSFNHYYMISNIQSHVSAKQFAQFCELIGVPCITAQTKIKRLVNEYFVEEVFQVEEYAFDSYKLKETMLCRIKRAGCRLHLHSTVLRVAKEQDRLVVYLANGKYQPYDIVFNCTYSNINGIITESELEPLPLKYRLAEIALVKVPDELQGIGITVVDGPFFSIMPYPTKNVHSLTHVRYTTHLETDELIGDLNKTDTAYQYMIRDAMRYLPKLSLCEYLESLYEWKVILPQSSLCDSRPIVLIADHGINGFHNVIGAKMDNMYDLATEVNNLGLLD